MKKNIIQDVIPPRKTIRNIELPERRSPVRVDRRGGERRAEKKSEVFVETEEKPVTKEPKVVSVPPPIHLPTKVSYKYEYDEPKGRSRTVLYISVAIFIIALAFGISALFKSAEIRVSPKQEVRALDSVFTARKDISTGGLGYQVVTVTKDVEKAVPAQTEQKIERKARGIIIVYNSYSSAPQRLVATTRFETPEGLIFRAVNNVSIPGTTIKAGKTVAGSAEVLVEADKVGAEYNIGLKDFTIVGFKGDPKYTKIYGRSKTPMTGGFSGMQKIVSEEVLSQAESEMEESLREILARDINSQIPSNFVLYEESLTYDFDKSTQVEGADGTALLKKKGTTSAVIFDKGSLSRSILATTMPESVDNVITVQNLDDLSFSFNASTTDPLASSSISFRLAGEPQFVWVFDENKLKSDLLGLSKKNARTVLSTYETIDEAWLETRPFWSQAIPDDPEKVTLVNTISE